MMTTKKTTFTVNYPELPGTIKADTFREARRILNKLITLTKQKKK